MVSLLRYVAKPVSGKIEPMQRKKNAYVNDDGKALVAKVKCRGNLKEDVKRAIELIGGIGKTIKKGDSVFLKPNLNSDDPFPASTDPAFAKAVAELVLEAGAKKVAFGDLSGPNWLPTERALGLGTRKAMEELGVEVIPFDDAEWAEVSVPGGKFIRKAGVSKVPFNYDRLVYLACLKVHKYARFTLSLKLTMGFMHYKDRMLMHADKLEEKMAEINAIFWPDLVLIDGRKAFVTEGPACGQLENPNVILAGGDRVAIDVEGIRILQSYKAKNMLDEDAWKLPMIKRAVEMGIGAKSNGEMEVVEG